MNWLWISLGVILGFLVFWFFFLLRISHISKNNHLKKIMSELVLIVISTDCIATLIWQPLIYWSNYSACNESNFLGKIFLSCHPLIFVFAIILWIMLLTFLINRMPIVLSSALFFVVFIGHAFGVWSWIGPHLSIFHWGFAQYAFYIVVGIIFAIVLKESYHSNKST